MLRGRALAFPSVNASFHSWVSRTRRGGGRLALAKPRNSAQLLASLTGINNRRRCLGLVIALEGSRRGQQAALTGLSNEGNTTLPHADTHTHTRQPSPIPGPIARVNHAICNRYAAAPLPPGAQAIKIDVAPAAGAACCVYWTVRLQI